MGALRSLWRVSVWLAAVVCLGLYGPLSSSAATRTVVIQDTNTFQDTVNGNNISRITQGDTVTWTWGVGGAGTVELHSTTSGICNSALDCNFAGDGKWNSGILNAGSFSHTSTFATPGSYPYLCQFHGFPMVGTIIVERPLHHFEVIAPASSAAGSAFSVTVTAKDSLNNTLTGYTGSVHFASSDPLAVLPANSVLVLNTGTATFSVTLKTSGSRSITVNDMASPGITGTTNVTVNPGAATQLVLTVPASASVGASFLVTVIARDQFNNMATGYTGKVQLTSSDPGATLPNCTAAADCTLTSGTRNFNVMLVTLGPRSITVTDKANGALTDTEITTVSLACSTTFTNTSPITINDATIASPYPSNVVVAGLKPTIYGVSVTLNGLTHSAATHIDVLLIGPGGKMIIMSDVGAGGPGITNGTITLNDSAASSIPSVLTSGIFKPTNIGAGDPFAGAPAGPYSDPALGATFASAFNGTNPNGTWSLYVVDDLAGGSGSIAGGWTLSFAPPPNTFCNESSISIPVGGASTPYPSAINVSGLDGTIRNISLRLDKLTHRFPLDIDMLLERANGPAMIVYSDAGGGGGPVDAVVTLDDSAAGTVPAPLVSGFFRPTNIIEDVDAFDPPAPAGPYRQPAPTGTDTFASTFSGLDPNVTWKLYVMDDFAADAGSIAGGWALSFDLIYNTTTSVGSNINPSFFGQLVTFTANVTSSGGTPTGTVTFKDGAVTLGTKTLSSGTAQLSLDTLLGGLHNITAEYSGDANFHPSTFSILVQTVNPGPTSTSVISSSNPSTFGQSVTFTATVADSTTSTPTGTVTFRDGVSTIGTGTLSGSVATLITSAVSGGSRSITAVYNGDSNFATSTSPVLTQTVNRATSTTAVTSSSPGNTSTFSQSVTFTATVSESTPGTATGTVTFKDGLATIGTGTLNGSGVATLITSTLTGGSHSITAVYAGDGNFLTSTSPALTQTVNKAITSASILSLLNPSDFSQNVLFQIEVTSAAGTPTGNVTVKDGAATIGTVTLAGGLADFNTAALGGGSHNITAVYNGDTNFNTSTSPIAVQQVNLAGTSTALISSLNPSTFGQSVTFTATVTSSSGTPAGTVTFRDGTTVLNTPALNGSGVATLVTSTLGGGSHSITATYNGNANFTGSVSAPLTQTVNKASSTTIVGSSLNPSTFGQTVTFTVTVTPATGVAGGTVTLNDGATPLASGVPLSGAGIATIVTSALGAGTHSITATFATNVNLNASTSPSVPQIVDQAEATMLLTGSKDTSLFRETVTFTVTVSSTTSGTPTGAVVFFDGATPMGGTSLTAGQASIAINRLTVGGHQITVQYSGDSNFPPSSSLPLIHYRSPKPR